ncbi:FAD binding domain protein [Cryphonectria parasitica EP155]|uniref:FAD binding domain protein n=1 Tax=Cryphonectria parasitica (strain ATCC 38755 / EP155) TaxID=660469 RepID=A0A9P5CI20_CRYP1|nr:FAD binding domain protein [Cryphonectria parasitica EP155]KAF3760278.1 FAD binding domain protein [Cryphonectria parasitica EP155]
MPKLKVLICGAGIAGNALAGWLSNLDHDITVIERFPSLRASGLQVDLRGHGVEVMKRMGIEKVVRAKTVNEPGMELVDSSGKSRAYFPANRTGQGPQAFTSEFEIMRGDLCRILYNVARPRVKFQWGISVQNLDDKGDFVEVLFSDGTTDRFDLVVGADGISSRTRRMMLGPGTPDMIDYIGVCISYFTIAREAQPGEEWTAKGYFGTGKRWILTRRNDPHRLQVYLGCDAVRLQDVKKGDVAEEKKALQRIFQGIGWEIAGILKSLGDTDDLYCERIGVVKMPSWSSNRVVLVGDAAHCPTPNAGMGVTSSLVGAYVLAGEIGHAQSDTDLLSALKAYDQKYRPFIDRLQHGISSKKSWLRKLFDNIVATPFGVRVLYWFITLIGLLRLDIVMKFFGHEDTKTWPLPDYKITCASGDEGEEEEDGEDRT